MTTFVTIKPHYCDLKYGEAVSDRIFYIKRYGIPKGLPVFSTAFTGFINSFRLPSDDTYFCEGPAELYPVYYSNKRANVVTTVKESTFWNMKHMSEIKRGFIVKLFSINHALITDTKFMRNLIKSYIPEMPVGVCPPFCAQPFFSIKPNLDSKSIVFIGSNDKNKGFLELIEAFKMLRSQDNEWNIYLLGNCSEMITEKMDGVHALGFVKDMKPYLSRCSLYVHPASFEVFGISVLEAMSAGLIPIVTRATGASEVLENHGLRNMIINDNSPELIAKKLLDVYNHKKSAKVNMSRKCKKIIRKEFLEKTNVKKFKRVFDGLAF